MDEGNEQGGLKGFHARSYRVSGKTREGGSAGTVINGENRAE